MTLRTPPGSPHSSSSWASAKADSGVSCAGFMTIVQPAAIAGPILRVPIAIGKFHGVMKKQGPTGWRMHEHAAGAVAGRLVVAVRSAGPRPRTSGRTPPSR